MKKKPLEQKRQSLSEELHGFRINDAENILHSSCRARSKSRTHATMSLFRILCVRRHRCASVCACVFMCVSVGQTGIVCDLHATMSVSSSCCVVLGQSTSTAAEVSLFQLDCLCLFTLKSELPKTSAIGHLTGFCCCFSKTCVISLLHSFQTHLWSCT